jgi:hypothetical protein
VLLPHPPIFHNRLCQLAHFSRTILLVGRCESEDSSPYLANSVLEAFEIQTYSERRFVCQNWIAPLRMLLRALGEQRASLMSVEGEKSSFCAPCPGLGD